METTRQVLCYTRSGNLLSDQTELLTATNTWVAIEGITYEYDRLGRETKRTSLNELSTVTVWGGNCCGKSLEIAPDGTRTAFAYDLMGRLTQRTVLDPNPIEYQTQYDALGRITAT